MDFESDLTLKEWAKDKPLSILQLDPADRAVLRIADERDAIQKKTFTKWVNKHLKKANRHVNDLFVDLQDGLNLISLLEVLSGEHLHREKGRMRFHALQNVELVLNYLRYKKIKLVNIRPEDIVDGNQKLTLGLIWTIILHFQISDIVLSQREENVSPKEVLLKWAKKSTARYPEVRVTDFTQSWRDGLAFNALIHRNRPDLVDWRTVKTKAIRERLENAFYQAEKAGVTRLLDPEDVDTHEIDEKSIITYISSLYDVFPEPPTKHPLYDNESQTLTHEYREVASSLHLWIREYTTIFSERTLPPTLSDLVKSSQEIMRFKTYEIPNKINDKNRLNTLYTELQKIYESTGEVDIEPELHVDVLERNWSKLMSLHQERDQQLQDEIKKFERLDRLAERLSRDCKRVDSRLDDVEQRVIDESKRLERLHPLDAKRNADSLESEMRSIEETIQSLVQDLSILKSVNHQSFPNLERRVNKLHQKWVALRSSLHQKLIARLASVSFPVVEERTVTRQTRTVLETRLVDTNHHFRSLQQAIEWCRAKIKLINESELGNDLAGVKIELSHHEREHKEIDRFKTTVEQCAAAKTQFTGEEQSLYIQHLNNLHKVYSELLTTSNKRMSDLESLLDYLQSLQNQLQWLTDKELIEITRDWSDININLQSVQHYHESLMSELEKREISVRSVLERGNSLILQNHPAGKIISRWTETLKEAWSRLLQFSLACEIHTEATRKYQEYSKDLREAEAWLQSRDELLNTVYSASEFSLDEGERLLKGMQEMREELNKKAPIFAELTSRAGKIPPIRQRRQPITRPIQVKAVCNFTSDTVYIEKDDTWLLHDNSALTHWRVSSLSSRSNDTNVPGVVFFIPPPGKELLEGAERLNRAFESTTSLWQKKHMRLRQNMIFATIRVVRSWDLAQFVGMGSEQRNAIRRALNEDADKLLNEGDPSDPQLRRLRREMDEVNRLFEELEKRARQEDEQKAALREFTEITTKIQTNLDEYERTLNQRILNTIPRDPHSLERLVLQHKDFENDLKSMTTDIENIQLLYNTLPRKNSVNTTKVENILQQWNQIWNYSHLYVERLKCVEIVLSSLDEARNVVSELEIKLASFGEMPSDIDNLRDLHDDLVRLQNAIAARQPIVDQLIDDATNVRRVVVRSRDRTSEREHNDLDRLDDDVNSVTRRWNDLCANLVDRLRSCESAYSILDNFGQTYQTEVKFIDESYKQLNELPPVSHAKHHIEPTKVLFTSIVERTQPLEQVNIDGGRFIREAKIFAVELRRYADEVTKSNPSFEKPESTQEIELQKIEQKLDNVNQKFLTLVTVMQDRIRQMAALTNDKELQEFVRGMKPAQLRTFRTVFSIAETTKQIANKWLPDTCDMGNQMNGSQPENPDIISEPCMTDGSGQIITVGEAIRTRRLDVRNGTIRFGPSTYTISQASSLGLINPSLSTRLLSQLDNIRRELYHAENPVSLTDLIRLRISDGHTVLDRRKGIYVNIKNALNLKLLDNIHEIYGPTHKITLKDSNFKYNIKNLQKPLSLKEALDLNMINDDHIVTKYGPMTLKQAYESYILDPNQKNILNHQNQLISLTEALDTGLIHDMKYSGIPLKQAYDYLYTVSILSIFDIPFISIQNDELNPKMSKCVLSGFKNDELNLKNDELNLKNDELNLKNDELNAKIFLTLRQTIEYNIFHNGSFLINNILHSMDEIEVNSEVKNILNTKIGIFSFGKELTAFEAVSLGVLDIETGLLKIKKGLIGYEEALKKNIITKKGVNELKKMLMIVVTTKTNTIFEYPDTTNHNTTNKMIKFFNKISMKETGNDKFDTHVISGNDKIEIDEINFSSTKMIKFLNVLSMKETGNDKFDTQNVISGAGNDKMETDEINFSGNKMIKFLNVLSMKETGNDQNFLKAGNDLETISFIDDTSGYDNGSKAGNDEFNPKNVIYGAGRNDKIIMESTPSGAGNDKSSIKNVISEARKDELNIKLLQNVQFKAGNDKLNTNNYQSVLFDGGNDKFNTINVICKAKNDKHVLFAAGNNKLSTQNIIYGAKYDKSVLLGAGNEKCSTQNVIFGAGNDKLSTQNAIFGAGNDMLRTQNAISGAGNDKFDSQNVIPGAKNDKSVLFGAGNDKLNTQNISGPKNDKNVLLGAGNDKCSTQNVISGAGNDKLSTKNAIFGAGNDVLSTQNAILGAGNDKFDTQNVIPGAKDDKSVLFGAGNDKLNTQNTSGSTNDKSDLFEAGNDKYSAQNVISGAGNYKLSTQNAISGAGNDILNTQNFISGAKYDKSVLFEAGNDKFSTQNVIFGAGNDKLSTQNAIFGAGNDKFNTQNVIPGAKNDKSVLFEAGNDKFTTQNFISGAGNDKLSTQNAIFGAGNDKLSTQNVISGAGNDKFNTQNVIPGAKNDKSFLFRAVNHKFSIQNVISGYDKRLPIKLSDAVQNEENNFYDPIHDKYITLRHAVESGLLDISNYYIQNNLKSIPFDYTQYTSINIQNMLLSGVLYEKNHKISFKDALNDIKTGFYKNIPILDAVKSGILDPNTIVYKDALRRRFVTIDEAFKRGLCDKYGRVNSIDIIDLIDDYVYIDKIDLSDAIDYMYDIISGLFNNPFNKSKLNLKKCLTSDLICDRSSMIKYGNNLLSIKTALNQNILKNEGLYLNMDLVKAKNKGYIVRTSRQAMEEKYKLSDDTLRQLLEWMSELEEKLSRQEPAQERLEGIREQINRIKLIKEELDSQTSTVQICLDEARHVALNGAEYLSRDEISHLERNSKSLKTRFDRATSTTDKLLRRINAAYEELNKYRAEASIFSDWLDKTTKIVIEKENTAHIRGENITELLNDVISRQADLRFITMAGQKFSDESKDFLTIVNEFRLALTSRPGLIEPYQISEIKKNIQEYSKRYKDLSNRVSALNEKLSGLGGRQREYKSALERVRVWLSSAEPRATKILSEPLAADPHSLEEQLTKTKSINNEFIAQNRLFEQLRSSLDTLIRSVEGQASRSEINELSQPVEELTSKYEGLSSSLLKRTDSLENALSQSQGVENSLENVVSWLSNAENNVKSLTRPASLNKPRLEEQVRSVRGPLSEIVAYRNSIESVVIQSRQLISTATNPRLTKRIDSKVKDVLSRYDKLLERCTKLAESFNEVNAALDEFNTHASEVENWLGEENVELERDIKREQVERVLREGRALLSRKDVTDTSQIRDRIKNIETQWRDLNTLLDERTRLAKIRAEQTMAYDKLRDAIIAWLNAFEGKMGRLEPVALHMDTIKRQTEELKPYVKEHRDFAPNIDKLYDLSTSIEERPESPRRLTKRLSLRKSSIESQSPTKYRNETHEITEINTRYANIGLKLNERSIELDQIREELRKSYEQLKNLDIFLDRINRSLPRDSLPNNKDEADKTLKLIKSLLEDMYEKQSLLESYKNIINDLLKRKSSEILSKNLQDITLKWKNINDICKNRIENLEDLKDFYDSHDHLNTWLNAKERMIEALGPISSDPRMVQSQVEQVQVLREELRTMRPQLSHLEELTQKLVHNNWTQLEIKCQNIVQRWTNLTQKLENRSLSLGAAYDSSREFDSSLNRLRDTLNNISDQVDNLKDEPEIQLRKIQNIERQLEGARQLLRDTELCGENLCSVLTDSRAEIQQKLTNVNKQYNTLQAKVDRIRAEIEAILKDGREFDAEFSKMIGWINEILLQFNDKLLISANKDILQQQYNIYEPIYKDILNKEHEIVILCDKNKKNKNMDHLKYSDLKHEAINRHTRLQISLENMKKYYKNYDQFIPFLNIIENKINIEPKSYNKRDLDKHNRDLINLRHEIYKKSSDYEYIKNLSETFLNSCDIDKDIVLNEMLLIKNRWDKINNDLINKINTLEELIKTITDLTERLKHISHNVQRCEDKLSLYDSIPIHNDPINRLNSIKQEVQDIHKGLNTLKNLIQDDYGLNNDFINVQERLSDLETRLNDRYERATQAQNALQKYNDSISKITSNLSNLEDIFGQMRPPGRDIQTVLNQQDENHNLSLKLSKLNDDLLITSNLSDILIDSGLNSDKYDQIHKRVQNLDKKIHNRSIILDTTKDKIEDFNAKIKKSDHLLNLAFDEIKFLKPIGLEPDTIRVQQEESALIRNNFVEPAGLSVETAVNCGQILVQTAEPDVSTIIVERDCEKITEKWNNLKEKMTDRDKKLNSGLLQSGKFQEALEGLLKWITDMEDMVANQKSPSADYKVVKAQLQEQKFLIKMLNDRQGSMNGLTKMGHEVASNCEGPEKLNIERQLNLLENRFVHLNENALNRMDILEKTMKIAQLYNDKMGISDWLQKTEKKIKDMQTVPTDEEKITLKIREHNQLHDEILNKKDDLSNLTDIASELATLVSEDDASLIADQVQNLADRYTKLVHNSDNVSKLLESARGRLRHLVVTYQQLQGWMENMDQRLSRFKILAVHTEQLYAQMEDLADLSEEISNKQSSVDSTVDAGHDLMRSISSDEAIQLKDKLDSLQRRYNDLTIRSSELLKQSQEALPSVQQFHSSHNKLVDWMNGAETTLKSDKEDSIIALEMDLSEFRPILDIINQLGPVLCTIGPGEGAGIIENLVLRDNRRFDAISEQVQRKAERIQLCKQRSLEVLTDVDSLLEWFREVEATLKEAEEPSSESNIIRAQLKEHKALNDDIASQKSRVRDVLDTAKKVLRESPLEDNSIMRDKMSDLRETMDSVWKMSGDRLSLLEQALGLSDHFEISHHELKYWLDDKIKEAENLRPFSIKPQFLIQDQKTTQKLLNSIIEHKPMIDKLNKTGENLIKLVQYDEKIKIQDILDQDNSKYDKLRLYLKQRQEELEKKIQETSEFSDKLEGMLRALENASDEINSTEDISAHTNKIKKQIKENENIYDEVQKRQDAFESVKKAANDVISKSPSDPAVSDIKNKLNKLQNLWNQVNQATKNRDKSLSQALEIALKFWSALEQVMTTLNDIERTLIEQEPPALKPELVRRQGEALGLVKNDIEQTKPKVEEVRRTGASLMALCGEPDKPEVRKNIEDLDQAWDSVTTLFARREENLLDAMERAMEFHETLRALKEFLQQAESRFAALGPLGEDITTIRGQMKEVKDLKSSLDPMMIKVESLNRQAAELTERSTAEQAHGLKESLSTVNHRWDELHRGIAERYRQLENALLRLGQFQQALTELLSWINTTDKTLEADNNNAVDPHILEVQLAKLKVLMNDISAHQSSVDTLNDAGRQIVQDNKDDSTNDRLKDLNHKWKNLINKANIKENNLEDNLKQMQRFTSEIHDLMGILNEADGVIASSKPVGGLPETASEQLDRFMILYNELEDLRPRIEAILNQGSDLIRKGTDSTSTQANLKNLKSKWDNVTSKGNDKKIKLEIALKEATEFSENLQNFVAWLTNAEKILNNLKPVSRVLETILNQIEEHKNFQKQVAINRENMLQLDKKGTHLKYFSQKQDVILIKNLLISVQHRWERVVSKSAERTRSLDHGYKESKDFHDSWLNLINFLKEIDSKLDEITETDPSKLRQKLQKHKEIQKQINGKQIQYENVLRNCKTLRERAPKSDENTLKNMGQDLKDLWNTINNKIIQRQRNLEEQLLYCGQIKEALDALLDWLKKTQNSLNEDALLHGDLDTVQNLIDKHTNLKQNIDNRSKQIESLQKSDIQDNTEQIQEMSQLWTKVKQLEQKRSNKLQNALKLAEELHTNVHNLLEFISDSETKLRTLQQPEDEVETRCILDEHDKFTQILAIKERDKDSTIRLAEDILRQAHPDAISVIKHWIQIIQSRWDEISSWSRQKSDKLIQQLKTLQDLDSLLEELLSYLADRESILINSERIDLPNDIKLTQELIDEHQNFMENMSKKTNEIETVVRAKTIKERKPSKKGSMQDVSDLARRQSLRSSRETLNDRKLSRSKEFLDPSLPHIGPKFPAKGSKTPEPQFKCARSRLLYDRWRSVWLMSWERQRRLRDHMLHLGEMERLANFSWDEWRKRFLRFMNHKKSRLTDLFRKMDKNNDGLIPREDFAEGIIKTKFDTNRPEMGAVADMFDHNNEGLIDWKEFIAALRPDWEERKPATEADKIHDEVKRLVMLCTCRQKFRVFQVGEGKYRFGDSQKLRLVRILRSTVMVRVGGGWVALEEFLVKNDPCRAKGRTNIELREQFILPEGVSQSMSAFKPKLSTEKKSPLSSAGPITKIREKSSKSVPMGGGSRGTPGSVDSLSDLDSPHTPNYMTPRKSSLRAVSSSTPGSLPGSRSNSRPQSRTNSKPPSRHASNLSLASSDDGTPSRIPRMSVPSRSSSSASGSAQRKLTAPGALNGSKSPSGRAGLTRASSIPTLVNRHSTSKIPVFIGDVSHSTSSSGQSRIPIYSYSNLTSPTSTSSGTPSGRTTPKSSR